MSDLYTPKGDHMIRMRNWLLTAAVVLFVFPGHALAGSNANAVLSLDLIADGGAGNHVDDGVTAGLVSGRGTTIAFEVFATGVTTPLRGVILRFDFDASLLSYVKAENSAFPLKVPEGSVGTNFAATTPVTLAPSGFLARIEFETIADVTGRAFTIGIEKVTLAESTTSSDDITTTKKISFNATASPDFNGDGLVDFSDLLIFAGAFGRASGDAGFIAQCDLDGDGAVGFSDLLAFAEWFGKEVPTGTDDGGTPPTSTDFDLDGRMPWGITYANNRFYVTDSWYQKVYVYTSTGQRVQGADFILDDDNLNPRGIAVANNQFYVPNSSPARKVYVYASTGQRVPGAEFDFDNASPYGIAYVNNRFYVPDVSDRKVFVYTGTGERVPGADFDLDDDNDYPRGIAYVNNRFYVLNWNWSPDRKVLVYTGTGQRVPGADFDLDDDNGEPSSITYANNRLYVTDEGDNKVYVYTGPSQ